ncbi:MAG TPA: tyrosine-type recombinase/integrase, partial [Jiangellaceae bacterium]
DLRVQNDDQGQTSANSTTDWHGVAAVRVTQAAASVLVVLVDPATGTPERTASGARGDALAEKGVRLHDLRHPFAALALDAGHDFREVSEWLGHADYTTTLRVYAHWIPAEVRNTMALPTTVPTPRPWRPRRPTSSRSPHAGRRASAPAVGRDLARGGDRNAARPPRDHWATARAHRELAACRPRRAPASSVRPRRVIWRIEEIVRNTGGGRELRSGRTQEELVQAVQRGSHRTVEGHAANPVQLVDPSL